MYEASKGHDKIERYFSGNQKGKKQETRDTESIVPKRTPDRLGH